MPQHQKLPANLVRFYYWLTLLACVASVSGGALLVAYLTHDPRSKNAEEQYVTAGWMAGFLFGIFLLSANKDWSETLPVRRRFVEALALTFYFLVLGPAGMAIGALVGRRFDPDPSLIPGAWASGGLAAVIVPAFFAWLFRNSSDDGGNFIRGTAMIDFSEARKRAERLLRIEEKTILWGGLNFPERFSEGHFCVVGAVGSGKTLALRLMMQTVLPSIKRDSDCRALVYDAKRDVLSLLSGMSVDCPIVTLNPFDARSAAWDMAKDITSPATALQVASILIPEEDGGNNRYFSDAARAILTGVLKAFILCSPGVWTFRDVVYVMRTERRLRDLLSSTPQTRELIDEYFLDPRAFENVKSTIASRMAVFEPIAALWSRATTTISLHDWLAGEFILVLGNDEALRSPLDAINRVLFQRVAELVINGSESTKRRTWFFLDEIKEAGKLDGLSRLLTKGRSKGARVVLGFQDIDGLRHVYGPLAANEIAGIPANKAILRLDSEATAKWAVGVIGEAESREYTTSRTDAKESSTTTNEHIVKRDAVLPSELMRLPLPESGAFWGYYVTPAVGIYLARRTYDGVLLPAGQVPDFAPRAIAEQYLEPWTDEDLKRLRLNELHGPVGEPRISSARSSATCDFLNDIHRVTR